MSYVETTKWTSSEEYLMQFFNPLKLEIITILYCCRPSKLDHSCEPNAVVTFRGVELQLRTTRPLTATSEVKNLRLSYLKNSQKFGAAVQLPRNLIKLFHSCCYPDKDKLHRSTKHNKTSKKTTSGTILLHLSVQSMRRYEHGR